MTSPRLPGTLREARDGFAASVVVNDPFGRAVAAHHVNAADVELAPFEYVVTDWERVRGFERL
jgi:glutamine synthetase